MIVPIHNHTEYSALDGYGKPKEIADRLEQIGAHSCGITDHGTVAGWKAFAKELSSRDMRPIFGMEAYQARTHRKDRPEKKSARDGAHLVLLAKNAKGYQNIRHLSDEANRSGFYYSPRVDWELLKEYREGVIATSACMAGLVAKGVQEENTEYLNKFLDIYRDDFFIEIHTYASEEQRALNLELYSIAKSRGIPMVAANDAHYPCQSDYENHEILMAIQYNKLRDKNDPLHPDCLFIMDEDQVRDYLSYLPQGAIEEVVANTELIASRCDFQPDRPTRHLPKFPGKDKSALLLIDMVENGLLERYGEFTEEVALRAEYELTAIIDADLADYFLIVADIVGWCKQQNIMTGPGRGSAAGSIISYALGITQVDPLKHGLYFERFWNPGRTDGMPDIDLDIEKSRREEVKEYLARKYGRNRVLSIGAYSTMGPKAAIRRVMKAVYGDNTNYIDINAISKILETTTDAGLVADWETIEEQVGKELAPYVDKYPDVFRMARGFTDRLTHYSTHASGVVVSDVDLPAILPCRQDRREQLLVTQVDMREVEKEGFVKIDLLGLRTLDTLKKTVELAGVPDFKFTDIYFPSLPDSFWTQVDKGHTLGFFQVEDGDSARRIGKILKPRSIDDLAALNALNRPGPLRTGAADRFMQCRKGQEPVYLHPILTPILQNTYGELIYQEQVLEYFKAIGYSLGEADEIRKILGKKLVDKMEEEKPRYFARASEYMDEDTAEMILNGIMDFAKYSFNRSHAVGYGTVLAWTMYAKWKWPTEFILASILTTDDSERIAKLIAEGRRMGISILPPDINHSGIDIGKSDDKIYFGLSNIKGVGRQAAQWVIDHRPYQTAMDFHDRYMEAQGTWETARKGKSPKQTLRSNQIAALEDAGAFDALEPRDLTLEEIAQMEEELLGIALTDVTAPIIARNRHYLDDLATFSELEEETSEIIPVPGIVTSVRRSKVSDTARKNPGEEFGWVTIEWQGDTATFAAFPEEYKKYKFMLRPRVVGRFDLKVSKRGPVMTKGTRYV